MLSNPMSYLENIKRPVHLVRAARCGLSTYHRKASLRRVLPGETPPAPGRAFDRLALREAHMDHTRKYGDATYSAARHVELLTALMDEARLRPRRAPVTPPEGCPDF